MAEFVTLALQDELHPKINLQEDKNMGNMRTLAISSAGGTVPQNQGLSAAQQHDSEGFRDRTNRNRDRARSDTEGSRE